ncbi:YhcH/YjgK/YiaL family protein [Ignavibacterium album]|uniref:YhcH/YjgK/YiaL family protein n=1 Tax=Ignavibacterium album TaxID=591197 RepID=UPI0035B6F49B
MIIDHIENRNLYSSLNSDIKKALDYLSATDFGEIESGKYEIDGENIFAIVSEYKTKDLSKGKPESHRKYIDVQYVFSGEEFIGYAPLADQKIAEEYNETNDITFYDCDQSLCLIQKNMFAIFFPTDIHMPGIRVNNSLPVKKIVVKVKVR